MRRIRGVRRCNTLRAGDRMRYSEFAMRLRDEDATALLNALTLGSGWLAYSVRLLTDNGDAAQVLRSLGRAAGALLLARRLLNEQGSGGEATLVDDLALTPDPTSGMEPPPLQWRDFLAIRTGDDGVHLTALLREAVGDAHRAGTAVLANDDVETIRLHLVGAVAALSDARRIVA